MTEAVHINARITSEKIDELCSTGSVAELKERIAEFKKTIVKNSRTTKSTSVLGRKTLALSKEYLLGELKQIEEAHTMERALYYLHRLKKSLVSIKTSSVNDINLHRWKEYDDIITDSLWVLDRRDTSGMHRAWYWGNFIPQIPNQLMRRYTKKGEWVLDPFAGSGTTLLEARRLGRSCLGMELQPSIARQAQELLDKNRKANGNHGESVLEVGDSAAADFKTLLKKKGTESVQLILMHPPYHNIIRFSRKKNDLSNAKSPEAFTQMFGRIVDNVAPLLDRGRMLAVVIGDKYENGEWIPLGFLLMNEVLKRRLRLKSIVVKNFEKTLGKRNQIELWRYRALAGGFYVFKHEYILIFQKG